MEFNSPKQVSSFRIKRRLDSLYSPTKANNSPRDSKIVARKLRKRFDSPVSMKKTSSEPSFITTASYEDILDMHLLHQDENSCDSGFSESQEHEQQIDASFELFDKFDTKLSIESPFLYSSSQSNSTKKHNLRHLKTKSKSLDSYNQQSIMQALDKPFNDDRFIGDMSRKHTLPILNKSKHNDLSSISADTLSELLNGKYNDKIGSYRVLDARYPYEFEGGHIYCAENAYEKEKIMKKLFDQEHEQTDKPNILIFHCEFSSERGPRLMREIREHDRLINQHQYPKLNYPEIYLLEGGYKQFFEQFDNLCAPKSYLPMLDDAHRNELKYFRKKSTSRKNLRISKTKLSF